MCNFLCKSLIFDDQIILRLLNTAAILPVHDLISFWMSPVLAHTAKVCELTHLQHAFASSSNVWVRSIWGSC